MPGCAENWEERAANFLALHFLVQLPSGHRGLPMLRDAQHLGAKRREPSSHHLSFGTPSPTSFLT